MLLRVLRMNSIVVLVLVAMQLFATPLLLPLLFGADYRAAVPAALLLVVAGGFSGLNLTLSNGLRGLGHPQTSLIAEVLGLVVTALGLLVLLPPLGILGAAAASLLAYASACGYLAVQLSRAVPRAAM
jgi:O-antigen/teichoic acid export membrane protein